MEILLSSTEDTKKLAQTVASNLKPGDVIQLFGDLGSGKTTFVSFLVQQLGFSDRVQSPTFVIHRKYTKSKQSSIKTIHHLDLYRIKDPSELADLDLADILSDKSGVLVIEWPEVAKSVLPENSVTIKFEITDDDQHKAYVSNLNR